MKKISAAVILFAFIFSFVFCGCAEKKNKAEKIDIDSEFSSGTVELFPGNVVSARISEENFLAYKETAKSYIEKYSLAHGVEPNTIDENGSTIYADYIGVSNIEFFDWDNNGIAEMLIIYSETPHNYKCAEKVDVFSIENSEAKLILSDNLGLCYGNSEDDFDLSFAFIGGKLEMIVHNSTSNKILNETAYSFENGKVEKTTLYAENNGNGSNEDFTNTMMNGEPVSLLEFMSVYSKYSSAEWDSLNISQNPINAEYTLKFLNGELDSYSFDRAYPCWNAYYETEHSINFYLCKSFVTDLKVQ